MTLTPRRLTVLVSLALNSMMHAAPVWAAGADDAAAQGDTPVQNAAAPDAAKNEVAEVIVTAQKTQQPISKVPMSISAMTQATLDKEGINNVADLARVVPGLTVRQNSEPVIAIRGLSSTVGASTTAIYIDDTPVQMHNVLTQTASAFPRLFDLDRVEVLRGPQGTLFGSGAEGGTIRFITPTPSLTETSGFARSGYAVTEGGAPSYEAGVAFGAPIVDGTAGFRASLWRQREGGYVDRVDPDTDDVVAPNVNSHTATVGRLAFVYAPTPRLTLTPSFYFQETRRGDKDEFFEDAGLNRSWYKLPQPASDRFTLSALTAQYDWDKVTLKSITSYFKRMQSRTDDYSYFSPSSYQGGSPYLAGDPGYTALEKQTTPQKNWNQELRLSSLNAPGDKLSWIGGVYFSRNKQSFRQTIEEPLDTLTQIAFGASVQDVFGVPNNGPYQWLEQEEFIQREAAAFGEVNYWITDKLKLTTGLRVARDSFTFTDLQDGPEAGGPHNYGGSTSETPVTPKFGLSYQLSSDDMLYATAAKGYRPGGANSAMAGNPACVAGAPGTVSLTTLGLADAPRAYGSDSVWSYEVGDKIKLFDRRLTLSASAYWIDWSKIQTGIFVSSCGLDYTTNLGNAVSKGLDLQAQARVLDSITLTAALGYGDAHYTSDAASGDGTVLAKAGDQLLNTPTWTLALGAQYDWTVGDNMQAYARLDYQYAGSYKGSPEAGVAGYEADLRDGPATSYFSTRAGLTRGRWELSAYVNNLLNSGTLLNRFHDIPGEGLYRNVTFRPRTLGVSATYRF